MQFVKSTYVSAYITALIAGLIAAGLQLASESADPAAWGLLLAAGAPAAVFARLYLAPVARTSAHLHSVLLAGIAGAGIAFSLAGPVHLSLAAGAIGFVLTPLYIYWYSHFPARDTQTLAVGQSLPDIALENLQGQTLTTAELTRRPAIWLFYRGNWCPLCMANIREVAEAYGDLHARGVEVYLVSPQNAAHTQSLAARYDVPLHFLRDPDNRAAQRLGILDKGGLPLGMQVFGYGNDVPMPTTFITAAGGRIVYSDLTDNYRVRPEPAAFIAELDRAGIGAVRS